MNHRLKSLLVVSLLVAQTHAAIAADLSVRIEGIRTSGGHLLVSVAGSPEAWSGAQQPAATDRIAADASAVEATFADLAPGRYAVQVMHDANDNGSLDSNVVGMPIEGYGFSNNPNVMRKATFEEAALDVPESGARITITLN